MDLHEYRKAKSPPPIGSNMKHLEIIKNESELPLWKACLAIFYSSLEFIFSYRSFLQLEHIAAKKILKARELPETEKLTEDLQIPYEQVQGEECVTKNKNSLLISEKLEFFSIDYNKEKIDEDKFNVTDKNIFTERKWKLESERFAENVLYELGMKCRYYNLVHSFILDSTDEFIKNAFKEEELFEIIKKENRDDPLEIDDEILESIDIAFSDTAYTFVVGCEKAGLASSERENCYRTLSNTEPIQRKAIGKKGDAYIRTIGSISMDWAALEDILIYLAGKIYFAKEKLRKLNIVGFAHAAGYICRYMKGDPLEVYADANNFSKSLDVLIEIICGK
ncbi:20154_t:CDS:10, partial [Dentiscutata erythropus]